MKTKFLGIAIIALAFLGCGTKKNASKSDNSENSVDWAGTYLGELLQEDSDRLVNIQLTLNLDKTYQLIATKGENDRNVYQKGMFEWDKNGRIITLEQVPHYGYNRFIVGENRLFLLTSPSSEDKPLSELMQLKKVQTDSNLTEKYWKLISVNERMVTADDFMGKEPHLKFKSEFNRVGGSDGCNTFEGFYFIEGNTLKFDKMMSTLMACIDSFVYEKMMKILREELTYEVQDELLIIQSKSDVLKFKAIYF